MRPVVVAITGASGAIYGVRLVQALARAGTEIELVVSSAGERVAEAELGLRFDPDGIREWLPSKFERVRRHAVEDIGANIASGSYPVEGMVVCPCSMGTLARIAGGLSEDLIQRSADVQLKERRPLVLVVRETPLSILHLENSLRIARAGATVLPAAPGFYAHPQSIEDLVSFVVERVLSALRIPFAAQVRWQGESDA